jgi:hypothetical protein
MKSQNLNFLEPSGPLQACNRTALHLPVCLLSHVFVNMEKIVRDLQGKSSSGRLLVNSEGTKSLKIITKNGRDSR